jgi:hypothetical protein
MGDMPRGEVTPSSIAQAGQLALSSAGALQDLMGDGSSTTSTEVGASAAALSAVSALPQAIATTTVKQGLNPQQVTNELADTRLPSTVSRIDVSAVPSPVLTQSGLLAAVQQIIGSPLLATIAEAALNPTTLQSIFSMGKFLPLPAEMQPILDSLITYAPAISAIGQPIVTSALNVLGQATGSFVSQRGGRPVTSTDATVVNAAASITCGMATGISEISNGLGGTNKVNMADILASAKTVQTSAAAWTPVATTTPAPPASEDPAGTDASGEAAPAPSAAAVQQTGTSSAPGNTNNNANSGNASGNTGNSGGSGSGSSSNSGSSAGSETTTAKQKGNDTEKLCKNTGKVLDPEAGRCIEKPEPGSEADINLQKKQCAAADKEWKDGKCDDATQEECASRGLGFDGAGKKCVPPSEETCNSRGQNLKDGKCAAPTKSDCAKQDMDLKDGKCAAKKKVIRIIDSWKKDVWQCEVPAGPENGVRIATKHWHSDKGLSPDHAEGGPSVDEKAAEAGKHEYREADITDPRCKKTDLKYDDTDFTDEQKKEAEKGRGFYESVTDAIFCGGDGKWDNYREVCYIPQTVNGQEVKPAQGRVEVYFAHRGEGEGERDEVERNGNPQTKTRRNLKLICTVSVGMSQGLVNFSHDRVGRRNQLIDNPNCSKEGTYKDLPQEQKQQLTQWQGWQIMAWSDDKVHDFVRVAVRVSPGQPYQGKWGKLDNNPMGTSDEQGGSRVFYLVPQGGK